ncbi:Asx homology domain-containing protein [Powellomyces hirtus]|nr:Asx homology domain-containing protein [Powellomyces hirtus]
MDERVHVVRVLRALKIAFDGVSKLYISMTPDTITADTLHSTNHNGSRDTHSLCEVVAASSPVETLERATPIAVKRKADDIPLDTEINVDDAVPLRRSNRRKSIRAALKPPPSTPPKRTRGKQSTGEDALTSKKSVLATVGEDLKKCFTPDIYHKLLTPEEQTALALLVPEIDRRDTAPYLPETFFRNNRHLRECIAEFQDSLGAGLYEPVALQRMEADVEASKEKYDRWKLKNYEKNWGDQFDREDSDDTLKTIKNTMSLTDLCTYDVLHLNDELIYERTFSKPRITVRCKVKVVSVSEGLDVQCGKAVWSGVETIDDLETWILDRDKRVKQDQRLVSNAWRNIRVMRSGKQLGALAALRDSLALGLRKSSA